MKTGKPISTISFNTPQFLKLLLDDLVSEKIITFYFFVPHKAEADEGGRKDHIHLWVLPSKMLQTDDLRAHFKEFDPEKPDKPRGCLPFESSVFDHAYLYFTHDKRYLASKGQSRQYHYTFDDCVTNDIDYLHYLYKKIDTFALSPYADILEAQSNGLTFAEFFRRGTIPLQQLVSFQKAWDLILCAELERNGKKNHPMDINKDTGEVIE